MAGSGVDYERHGKTYARHRRPDFRIEARIHAALGDAGTVLNVGAGSGSYEPRDRWVLAVEPSATMRAQRPQGAAPALDARAEALPFEDDSFDAALSTWTLCTIPDVAAALGEVRRVLRPGGTLHFLEHGLAPDERVRRWQRRLDPVQTRIAGGCHLTRPIVELLTAAGFTIHELDVFYEKGGPKVAGADSLGIAVST
jgi:SAM-dependent methyltransferase